MTIKGWESKYREILKEFGYSRKKDNQSCKLLDSLLPKKTRVIQIKDLIENKPVFVVGAGPSLPSCIPILKKHRKITKIVADGATRAIIENGLKPDIVVTDLDGDIKTLKKAGITNSIMVVHAHGDNTKKIYLVKNFKNCLGKLRRGKKLLEWLAKKSGSELYSTTKIKGFIKINLRSIDNIITAKNAF